MKNEEMITKKQNKVKSYVMTAVIFIVFFALVAILLWVLSGEGNQPKDKVVFTVGDCDVYLDEVNFYCLYNVVQLGITTSQLDTVTTDDGIPASEYYKEEILRLIMNTKVAYKKATDEGVVLTEEEKETVQNDVYEYMSALNASVLKEFGISTDTVMNHYMECAVVKKYEEQVTGEIEMEEFQYATLYVMLFPKVIVDEDGNFEKGEDGESAILLSDEEVAEAKKNAQEALSELKEGAEVSEIVKKYGIEKVSGEESNLVGSFGEPFDEYASTLKEGEFSPVIDLDAAYVIVQMVEENNEELAEQIKAYYLKDKEQEVMDEAVNSWYEEYGVESEPVYKGKTWDKISLYDFAKYMEE